MKEVPLSLCEKSSLLSKIKNKMRLDGRSFLEERPLQIIFGKDFGCATVILGETKVLAQVTCDVVEPRPSRGSEGKVSFSVHMSPMAAPHFEPGRINDNADELLQLLDRNIKESKCLDMESLCILADESVWQFKVDVTILNHAGNLGDACNIAAVAALRHFHRPDVTVEEDGRVTVHTPEERELIPTFMKKVPICLTFAFFLVENEYYTIMDPTVLEERVMSDKLTVGLNPHGEITSLLFPGKIGLQKKQIMRCVNIAFEKAKETAEKLMKIVEDDLEDRKSSVFGTEGYLKLTKNPEKYSRAQMYKEQLQIRISIPASQNVMDIDDAVSIEPQEVVMKESVVKEEDSEEEFPRHMLSQSLSEVRAETKKKKKAPARKKKKVKIESEEEDIKPKLTSLDLM